MTHLELIRRVRDHYVDQYQVFVDLMFEELGVGAAEVQFEVQQSSGLHRRLMRSDFAAKKDDQLVIRGFVPDLMLEFPEFRLSMTGPTTAIVESLRWDNVDIEHDALPRAEHAGARLVDVGEPAGLRIGDEDAIIDRVKDDLESIVVASRGGRGVLALWCGTHTAKPRAGLIRPGSRACPNGTALTDR